jgi:hypothetical protein
MGEKRRLSTPLACSEGNCARNELSLYKLPAINGDSKQLFSGLRDKFKYHQPASHVCSERETEGNRETMTVAAIYREGKPYAY